VSPNGGSLMTDYGRGLSKELLSMYGAENEEGVLNGLVHPPKWLLVGGDVRIVQTYLNSQDEKQSELFLMQAEVAAAVKFATQWTAVASIGLKGGPPDRTDRSDGYSRQHYIMYQPTETVAVRAGRFMPQYGLNEPNHTITIKDQLGFAEQSETYNVEASYLGEKWDAFATAIGGRPDDPDQNRETGFALSSSVNLLDKNKVGVSAYHGKANDVADRWLGGVWGILSLTKQIFLMTEFDHQWSKDLSANGGSSRGIATYQRLGYEATKGLQLYATHQLGYLNFEDVTTRTDAFGPGIDFFPRPHVEIRGEFLKQRVVQTSPEYFDFAWLIGHYYF
jgi:hypothetical protein